MGQIHRITGQERWLTSNSIAYVEVGRIPLVNVTKGRQFVGYTLEANVDKDRGRGFFRVRATSTGCWWLESTLNGAFLPEISKEERIAQLFMGLDEVYHEVKSEGHVEISPNDSALVLEARSQSALDLTIRSWTMTLFEKG